jgi:hypothetical protein
MRAGEAVSYEDGWEHFADVWRDNHVLWLVRPADPYALLLFWNSVLAERPWPTGWEDWRPDPQWSPPSLPEGWDNP